MKHPDISETIVMSRPTETADFRGRTPPALLATMNLDGLLRHLEDARPSITDDADNEHNPPDRYVIGRELGSGSIGQVIEARDQHLGRQVAIKILREGEGISRDGIARFVSEAQITAQLEHPSVVPVHEIGLMPDGMPYFSMKLVKGQSLGDIINHLRIGDRDTVQQYGYLVRLRLFQRICQGMAYAHAKGVVHRDLKPDNILIGEYGEVQIMDWGLAAVLDAPGADGGSLPVATVRHESRRGYCDGAIVGTPAYMSPEQASGEPRVIGPASDVFALGLMLAEFLSLVRVNRESSFSGSLKAAGNPAGEVSIRALAPATAFSAAIDGIVRKATRVEISLRYQNAGELSSEIAKIIEDQLSSLSSGCETPRQAPSPADHEARYGTTDRIPEAIPPFWRNRCFWLGAIAALAACGAIRLLSG